MKKLLVAVLIIINCTGFSQTESGLRNDSAALKKDEPLNGLSMDCESLSSWDLKLVNGAQGYIALDPTVARSGKASIKVVKTNSIGSVQLKYKEPVKLVTGKQYTYRGWFHVENAPLSSLLLFRLAQDNATDFPNPYGLYNFTAENHIPNSVTGKWMQRVANYRGSENPNEDVTIQQNTKPDSYAYIILYGNPSTVWIDDVEITPVRTSATENIKNYSYVYSEKEVDEILAKRKNSQLSLETINSKNTLVLDGKPIPPTMYFAIDNNEKNGDYEGFGNAGIALSIVPVTQGVWLAKDKFNFKAIDECLMRALRKNPNATIIADIDIYPYDSWVTENPDAKWFDGKEQKPTPSYQSRVWWKHSGELVKAIVEYIQSSKFSNIIVGYHIFSGVDGRAQLDGADVCKEAQLYYKEWITKKYKNDISALNKAWKKNYSNFDQVTIFENGQLGVYSEVKENQTPYTFDASANDYLVFRRQDTWQMFDYWAGIIKQTSKKPVVVACYREPDEDFLNCRNLDLVGNDSYYPFRRPGWVNAGLHRYNTDYHKKMIFLDLDLRSFTGPQERSETGMAWVGNAQTPEDVTAVHKKMIGMALGSDIGYWYYDMAAYFQDPFILNLTKTINETVKNLLTIKPKPYMPDVCLVHTGRAKDFETVFHNTTSGNVGMYAGFNNDQEMMLYSSGVPFDRVYLDDILKYPKFQKYKVYIFLQNTYISLEQRQQINKLLKNNGRTLVWIYDSGYISENGKSVDGISELTGIKINTKEVFQRNTPLVIAGSNPLVKGVLPFQSASELMMANFKLAGLDGAMAPGQPFWIDDPAAKVFAKYQETGLNAMAVKDLGTWKSIYLAGAGSLGNDLLNNIAKSANAYTVCSAGIAEMHTNGTFISIHALQSGEYDIQLPPGRSQVLEAETGKLLQENKTTYKLKLEAQKTYWLIFK